ncbi:MAG: NrsF family protein [Candidatus Binataceae bacterium]
MSEIANTPRSDHETRHHALVENLVAELRPVRRLWPISARLGLWTALEICVLIFLIRHGDRTDLAQQLRNPWYIFGVAGFAATGVIGAALALRAAVPGREPRATEIGLLMVLAVASALLLLRQPVDANVPLGNFVDTGLPCALGIAIFAALPWLALLWAVRRGAPLTAGLDGALIGAAAFLFSFALMRVNCPIDDGLHLFVWHFLPALAGTALSACAGIAFLRRRVRR